MISRSFTPQDVRPVALAQQRMHASYADRRTSYGTVAALVGITWGALAFGAVYPWAYWPLIIICVTSGILGLVQVRRSAVLNRPIALGCLIVIASVVLQLLPLPQAIGRALSPSGERIVSARELGEASPVADSTARSAPSPVMHPLSINPGATRRGLLFAAAFALFLLGITRVLGERETRRVARVVMMLGVVLAIEGIVQSALASKIYGLWKPYYLASRPFGPFVNRNHFAGWMVMTIPLSLGYFCARVNRALARTGANWRDRSAWLGSQEASRLLLIAFGILLMALALMMTLSRSGIISLLVALLVVGTVIQRRHGGRPRPLLVITLLLAAVALIIGWAGSERVLNRFAASDTLELSGRPIIWRDTIGVVRAFPLVGSGLNTHATAMAFYGTSDSRFNAVEAHSDYLQLAAEGGILVSGAAVVMLALFVIEARRRLAECAVGSSDYWIRIGAGTGLVAIAVQELVEFSLQMPGNAALFVVLCAVVVHRRSPSGPSAVTIGSPIHA